MRPVLQCMPMQIRRLFPYLTQGILLGVILGLIGVFFLPQGPLHTRPVVQIKEVARTTEVAAPGAARDVVSYAGAVQVAAPSVVNIHTTKTLSGRDNPFLEDPAFRRFFGVPPQRQTSLGSGVVVSPDGYILTNNHVIEGADEIVVSLDDGRNAQAKVVGTDPETDIAVLKIPLAVLPAIVFGDSDALHVGDVVLAIGDPYGVGQTVTQGIVSATGRKQLGISTFENFIQTDAAINPGNSGGALINPRGELIGINTAIFSRSGGSQGIGFAIPTSIAKRVMTQIIEHGETIRGWLGVEIQTLTPELAESFQSDQAAGVVVAGVLRDGPGAQAGLQPGDIITGINGQAVADAATALDSIAMTPPGSTITLQVQRNGKPLTVKVESGKRPKAK